MSEVKYSIQICEDNVRLSGILNIEQMFDMLNYFEKKGFTHCLGADVNSIVLIKNDDDDFAIENFIDKDEHVQNVFEIMYEEEKSENINLRKIVNDEKDENIKFKSMIYEYQKTVARLVKENEKLKIENENIKFRNVYLEDYASNLSKKIKGEIDGI